MTSLAMGKINKSTNNSFHESVIATVLGLLMSCKKVLLIKPVSIIRYFKKLPTYKNNGRGRANCHLYVETLCCNNSARDALPEVYYYF